MSKWRCNYVQMAVNNSSTMSKWRTIIVFIMTGIFISHIYIYLSKINFYVHFLKNYSTEYYHIGKV